METGYHRRFARLKNASTGNSLFVALDHGLTGGPPAGFEHLTAAVLNDRFDFDRVFHHKGDGELQITNETLRKLTVVHGWNFRSLLEKQLGDKKKSVCEIPCFATDSPSITLISQGGK